MSVVVFTGPTLSRAEVTRVIDAVCLPPAAQGDVYRAALRRPEAIAIIDGTFELVPSVWHKEILWALSRGIHVFGSSSLGALRAAELERFGMVGVGVIFESFRDGVLEDDDEVAVVHGPTEETYQISSEPMVHIRASLARAFTKGVIVAETRDVLLELGKALFYPERSWGRLLDLARAACVSTDQLDRLAAWLPHGAVNQKREDAVAMLASLRAFLETAPGPKRVSFRFEETLFWEEFVLRDGACGPPGKADEAVLDALRRDPDALERAEAAALGWWLAGVLSLREGGAPGAPDLLARADAFCRRKGITDPAGVARWLETNAASRDDLERWLEQDTLATQARQRAGGALTQHLLDYLRWTGDYAKLLESAGPSTP
ncbi:MAG: hypothetical protein HY900_14000 [Deltaproteobacteria bacterium]|nr:hypothetical protein [Deltaproteobacteria bacterium]